MCGKAADVVQVAVGNQVGAQFVLDLFQVGGIGNAVVDTRQVNAQVNAGSP